MDGFFQGFKDPNVYLYHYTSVKVLVDHILPKNELRVGRYLNTNDPKETKDWQFNAGTIEKRNLENYDLDALSHDMTRGMKRRTNVICFTQDRELTGSNVDDIHNRGFCRPRMWAQYAENHAGVCLIFDFESLTNAVVAAFPDHRRFAGPVSYKNRTISQDLATSPYVINIDWLESLDREEYLAAHIYTHHARLFFEKSEDWRDEVEYRWVLFGEEDQDLFLDFEQALVGVVFGASCASDHIREIEAFSEQRNEDLWFEQLIWQGCAPWVSWKWAVPSFREAR